MSAPLLRHTSAPQDAPSSTGDEHRDRVAVQECLAEFCLLAALGRGLAGEGGTRRSVRALRLAWETGVLLGDVLEDHVDVVVEAEESARKLALRLHHDPDLGPDRLVDQLEGEDRGRHARRIEVGDWGAARSGVCGWFGLTALGGK